MSEHENVGWLGILLDTIASLEEDGRHNQAEILLDIAAMLRRLYDENADCKNSLTSAETNLSMWIERYNFMRARGDDAIQQLYALRAENAALRDALKAREVMLYSESVYTRDNVRAWLKSHPADGSK